VKALFFLLIPAAVVAVYCVVLWVRQREPTSLESGIDAFRREMQALSPDHDPHRRHRPAARRSEPGDR
jgi:hypothetical protein